MSIAASHDNGTHAALASPDVILSLSRVRATVYLLPKDLPALLLLCFRGFSGSGSLGARMSSFWLFHSTLFNRNQFLVLISIFCHLAYSATIGRDSVLSTRNNLILHARNHVREDRVFTVFTTIGVSVLKTCYTSNVP